MSRINETRQIIWHETCKCVCRLTSAVCNSGKIWNEDKCGRECKEDLINKMACDKGYIWNLVIVHVNVINYVTLVNIYTIKIVFVERVWLIN